MTADEFKNKWSRYQGKETSAYQSHFDDLCRLLGEQTPNEADPSGSDFFCFQKRVVKDAELFEMHETPDASEPEERGFADVWKKGCFAWEYKGKKKNLEEAYKQLLRYRESLLNPPLLVVCDFDRYIVKTKFTGRKIFASFARFFPNLNFSSRSARPRKSPKKLPRKSPPSPSRFKAARASSLPMPDPARK